MNKEITLTAVTQTPVGQSNKTFLLLALRKDKLPSLSEATGFSFGFLGTMERCRSVCVLH